MTEDSDNRYPKEFLDEIEDEDGVMPLNVDTFSQTVIGRRIVSVTWDGSENSRRGATITLDDGTRVRLCNTDDCCAYTELRAFLLHPEMVDHMILGVGTTDGFQTWHVYADLGDVLQLTVGWSCGNPGYYFYGFNIKVQSLPEAKWEFLT